MTTFYQRRRMFRSDAELRLRRNMFFFKSAILLVSGGVMIYLFGG